MTTTTEKQEPQTFALKTGYRFTSTLTDHEAQHLASRSTSEFGTDLAFKHRRGQRLSTEQIGWMHKIALEVLSIDKEAELQRKSGKTEKAKHLISRIVAASKSERYVNKFHLATETGTVCLAYSGTGKNAGTMWIKNNKNYKEPGELLYGKIDPDGVVTWTIAGGKPPIWVKDVVDALIEDFDFTVMMLAESSRVCPRCGMKCESLHSLCASSLGIDL